MGRVYEGGAKKEAMMPWYNFVIVIAAVVTIYGVFRGDIAKLFRRYRRWRRGFRLDDFVLVNTEGRGQS